MNCVKYIRDKNGITQEELSELSGVSRDCISKIENKRIIPYPKTKRKIVNALSRLMEKNLTINDIF